MMNSKSTCHEQFKTNMFCDLDALNRINNVSCNMLYRHNQFEDNNNNEKKYSNITELI